MASEQVAHQLAANMKARVPAEKVISQVEAAGITLAANATDPQVKLQILYVVSCATVTCTTWVEGKPVGYDEDEALISALTDFEAERRPDGKLYCLACFTRLRRQDDCAERGHWWNVWVTNKYASGKTTTRSCSHCTVVESKPAEGE